jgi:catechol 2,3-dioxygenase-like lactoylglutathione lyase family enzyme
MELRGVHHVSLNVADHAVAERFYTEVMGLEPIPRPDFGFPGSWLTMKDGRQLHLIQVEDWTAPKGQHFAFQVADLDAVRAELAGKGVKVSEPFEIPGVGRQSFLKDPCGNLLELNEPCSA